MPTQAQKLKCRPSGSLVRLIKERVRDVLQGAPRSRQRTWSEGAGSSASRLICGAIGKVRNWVSRQPGEFRDVA